MYVYNSEVASKRPLASTSHQKPLGTKLLLQTHREDTLQVEVAYRLSLSALSSLPGLLHDDETFQYPFCLVVARVCAASDLGCSIFGRTSC